MRPLLAALLPLLLASGAAAHEAGLSTADVTVEPDRVRIVVRVSEHDLAGVPGWGLETRGWGLGAEVRVRKAMEDQAATWVMALRRDGDAIPVSSVEISLPEPGEIEVDYRYSQPARHIRMALLDELPPGHRQFVTIRSTDGRSLATAILHTTENTLALPD